MFKMALLSTLICFSFQNLFGADVAAAGGAGGVSIASNKELIEALHLHGFATRTEKGPSGIDFPITRIYANPNPSSALPAILPGFNVTVSRLPVTAEIAFEMHVLFALRVIKTLSHNGLIPAGSGFYLSRLSNRNHRGVAAFLEEFRGGRFRREIDACARLQVLAIPGQAPIFFFWMPARGQGIIVLTPEERDLALRHYANCEFFNDLCISRAADSRALLSIANQCDDSFIGLTADQKRVLE